MGTTRLSRLYEVLYIESSIVDIHACAVRPRPARQLGCSMQLLHCCQACNILKPAAFAPAQLWCCAAATASLPAPTDLLRPPLLCLPTTEQWDGGRNVPVLTASLLA